MQRAQTLWRANLAEKKKKKKKDEDDD